MNVTLQDVLIAVCDFYKTESSKIFKNSRKQDYVKLREVFSFIAYENCNLSFLEIGKYMFDNGFKSGMNHTTILHYKKKMDLYMEVYPNLRNDVMLIMDRIKNSNPIVVKDVNLLELCKYYSKTI